MFDVFLNFNTAFVVHGTIVKDRKEIFKNYLSGTFWYDFFIIIPFIISLRVRIDFLDAILIL
jgi:hypothetical protein